jgi:hypothetical protein
VSGGFHISQGLDVLQPRSGKAYPIPCEEWELLKERLERVSTPPWICQTAGSILAGVALSTFVVILTNTLPLPPSFARVIAWAVVAVSALGSVLSYYFGYRERDIQAIYVRDVIKQMQVIERRYEQS